MKLIFEINDKYIVQHTISAFCNQRFSDEKYIHELKNFEKLAWNMSEHSYRILGGDIIPSMFSKNLFSNDDLNLNRYLVELISTKEFELIKKHIQDYQVEIENEWYRNYETTLEFLKKYTSLSFEKEITVFLTHPSLKNGRYFGGNQIGWGHKSLFDNYNTIYLWHEILHSYFEANEVSHAVIELLTDEHMRLLLNGESYPPFVGHSYLSGIKQEILPLWLDYINDENPNFETFMLNFKNVY